MARSSRSSLRWPGRRRWEVLLVAGLFALLLCAFFPRLVTGAATLTPNGLLAGQSGKPRVDYPYAPPARAAIGDAGATVWLFEPWAKTVHEAYADGAIPLWDPDEALGAPLAASMQPAPFSPMYAPVFVRPTQRVWSFVILLRLLVGGVGCFALLRALGARPAAALVPAVGYLLAPAYVFWAAQVSMSVEAVAPWLLLAILELIRAPSSPRFAAVSFLTALAVVGGQPEVLVALAWLASAWAIYCWLRAGRSWPALARVAGAGAVGGLLAAPQLLLFAEYLPLALSSHKTSLGGAHLSFSAFEVFLLGDAAKEQATIGIGLVALAIAGIAARPSAGILDRSFMTGAIVVWTVRALRLPGHQVVGLLPGIDSINVRRYGEFVVILGAAVLAAAGVEALLRGDRSARYAAVAAAALPPVLVLAGAPKRDAALAFGFALTLAAAGRLAAGRPAVAGALALVLVAQSAVLASRDYARPYDPFAPRPFAAYVRSHLRPGERAIGVKRVLRPALASALRIADPRTGDALRPTRFAHYTYELVGGRPAGFAALVRMRNAASPFLSALGVRYLLAPASAGRPPGSYRAVFRDESDPSTRMTVWENVRAYPRGWLPDRIRPVADERAALAALRAGDGDLRTLTVVEDPTPRMRAARGGGTVEVESIGWNQSRFAVSAVRGSAVLVVSELFYPGWEASVDGRATPIRAANVTMRAVAVPRGRHLVTFRYRPVGLRVGAIGTALGLLVLGAHATISAHSRRSGRARARGGGPPSLLLLYETTL